MRSDLVRVAALAACLLAAPARDAAACGPDFPPELLTQRDATLLELPDAVFVTEATRLVPAPAPAYVIGGVAAPPVEGLFERALYRRGAAAFADDALADADAAFTAVLALPPALRRHRSTWAAYMLGRVRAGDPAIAAYRQVRALVAAGFFDEGGLAASSLGQEARLHLAAGDAVTAVRLYAEQAAGGHAEAPMSLLFVVRTAIAAGSEAALAREPVGQRLLATYLDTRTDELSDVQRARLWRTLTAIDRVAGADRLAAAAYRAGRWDDAAHLVGGADDTALARWVRAKLALRAGDRTAAAALLRGADAADPQRVEGERATLALAEGQVGDAMRLAWGVRRTYPDAAYLAERVLTIDELAGFVATLPAPQVDPEDGGGDSVSSELMRGILARRLMRAGRPDEALAYFAPAQQDAARGFGRTMARARHARDPIDRARELYLASTIARRDGLEILGTTYGPDWGIYQAEYDLTDDRPRPPDRWTTTDELGRVAASAPVHDQRYQYRFVASALSEQAAALLPRHTQAYAATLCESARQIFSRDPDRAQALWRRYVAGAPAAVALDFGQTCPVPDFAGARRAQQAARLRPVLAAARWIVGLAHRVARHVPRVATPWTRPSRWPLVALLGLCAAVLAGLIRRTRPPTLLG